ncbi:MAG: hypothetical protein BWY84_01147 [Candidatus Aerophobetes bacterium ADurb.Bin490]|nr:MAG: hypothetical protein BWY84_01147 [Candidatus Aerophobetes bacterium ADurb.Bin490]
MVREPVVAGTFYEKSKEGLIKQILELKKDAPAEKVLAKGIMVPHAGYMYSGKVAAETFNSVEIPDTVIILGPNHTGVGVPVSIYGEGAWKTPLGEMQIDKSLAADIMKKAGITHQDRTAHAREHSIEVMLPFLQQINNSIKFVPVCLAEPSRDELKLLGKALAEALDDSQALIIASSDLTHYESAEIVKEKDKRVIDEILKLDPDAMLDAVEKYQISMCGWMPVYVMLLACKELGASEASLVRYMTSGDITGETEQVVGYGGIIIK